MRNYIGLVHKDTDSDFGVSVPDFPSVVIEGASLGEARLMAEEALYLHIEDLIMRGEVAPEPSTLRDVMADPVNKDGVAILLVFTTRAFKSTRISEFPRARPKKS